jgi:hypothetical protein
MTTEDRDELEYLADTVSHMSRCLFHVEDALRGLLNPEHEHQAGSVRAALANVAVSLSESLISLEVRLRPVRASLSVVEQPGAECDGDLQEQALQRLRSVTEALFAQEQAEDPPRLTLLQGHTGGVRGPCVD